VNAEEIEAVRNLFPKMPRQVFHLWILPGVEFYGWPFPSVNECTIGTKWEGFFGSYPMRFWADAIWKLLIIPGKAHLFRSETEARIHAIIENAEGVQNSMKGVHRSIERFRKCVASVQEHGKIRDPLVGTWTKEGFDLVDGHHRLAAVAYLGLADNLHLPVWVADPGGKITSQ